MKTGSTLVIRWWLDANVRELLKYTRILMLTCWVCTRCVLAIALKSICTYMLLSKRGVAVAVTSDILFVTHDIVLLSVKWRGKLSIFQLRCEQFMILKVIAGEHALLMRYLAKHFPARLRTIAEACTLLGGFDLIVICHISQTLETKGLMLAGVVFAETAFAATGELDWGLIKHFII